MEQPTEVYVQDEVTKSPEKKSYFKWRHVLVAWFVLFIVVSAGIYFGVDKFVVGGVALVITLATQAFTGLSLFVGAVPVVGPVILHVLSIPFVWIINGIGYVASLIAIKRGYSKDVITYRSLTVAVIVGITIGYILGKYI